MRVAWMIFAVFCASLAGSARASCDLPAGFSARGTFRSGADQSWISWSLTTDPQLSAADYQGTDASGTNWRCHVPIASCDGSIWSGGAVLTTEPYTCNVPGDRPAGTITVAASGGRWSSIRSSSMLFMALAPSDPGAQVEIGSVTVTPALPPSAASADATTAASPSWDAAPVVDGAPKHPKPPPPHKRQKRHDAVEPSAPFLCPEGWSDWSWSETQQFLKLSYRLYQHAEGEHCVVDKIQWSVDSASHRRKKLTFSWRVTGIGPSPNEGWLSASDESRAGGRPVCTAEALKDLQMCTKEIALNPMWADRFPVTVQSVDVRVIEGAVPDASSRSCRTRVRCAVRCRHGDSVACRDLGWIETLGRETADREFTLACDGGDGEACMVLAKQEARPAEERAKLAERGLPTLRRACSKKDGDACLRLALYVEGDEQRAAYKTAGEDLAVCCSREDAAACGVLGMLNAQGSLGEKNPVAATALYREGCEGGDADACIWRGMELQSTPDNGAAEALALYDRACRSGHPIGCWWAGHLLSQGAGPVAADQERARWFFALSCAMGFSSSCSDAGGLTLDRGVVPRNFNALVDLNTAAQFTLTSDLGLTPAEARKVVAARPLESLEALGKKKVLSEKRIREIEDLIQFSSAP